MLKIGTFFKNIKTKIFNAFFKVRYGTVMFMVGAIVVFWDLFFKFFTDGMHQSLIEGVLSFSSSHNPGAAWSIFSDSTLALTIISLVMIIALIVFNVFYKNKTYFYSISLGLVLSGAFGNLFDRIRFGYVRDFIKVDFINFPTFNLADSAITIGVILLCVYFVFFAGRSNKSEISKVETNNQNGTANEE